jgi:hypothetical protein
MCNCTCEYAESKFYQDHGSCEWCYFVGCSDTCECKSSELVDEEEFLEVEGGDRVLKHKCGCIEKFTPSDTYYVYLCDGCLKELFS